MARKKYVDPTFKTKFTNLYRLESSAEVAERLGKVLHSFDSNADTEEKPIREATVNDWKKGRSFPDVSMLKAICKDRNISADYLLDLIQQPHSLNADYKSAVITTGLSEKTIEALTDWFDGYGVIMLNRFVESGHYEALMITLLKSFKVISFYGNDKEGIPTKDDWVGYYSREMGSILNSFMWDVLKDLSDAQIPERITSKLTEKLNSMTPEQRQAKMDIMGSKYFFEKLFEEIRQEMDEEV